MTCARNHYVVELMAAAMPYQKVAADKWRCPGCGVEVVAGRAMTPLAEHWEAHYGAEQADLQFWGSLKDKQSGVVRHAPVVDRTVAAGEDSDG
jgi:hypothetical protein